MSVHTEGKDAQETPGLSVLLYCNKSMLLLLGAGAGLGGEVILEFSLDI